MGLSNSTPVINIVEDIKAWPWHRVEQIKLKYTSSEYGFGVDSTDVANLLGLSKESAQGLIHALTAGKNERCNLLR